MKKIICITLILTLLLGLCSCQKTPQKFSEYYFDWFDTATIITGYETSEAEFKSTVAIIEDIFNKYHKLFDIYNKYEGVNNLALLNETHLELVVEPEIIELIEFSKQLYFKTNGKFNIAMGGVLRLWHNYRENGLANPDTAELPPMDKLNELYKHSDINNVVTNTQTGTVLITDPKLLLDVGAIAKGFACQKAANALAELGKSGYIINAGGNVTAVGKKPDGNDWNVGIENPDTTNQNEPYIEQLKIHDCSVVTSGSYQRFYTVGDKNYHHIIDPKTLMPSERYLSVSVVCNDSALADAMSTALFNMDISEGKQLVGTLDNVEAMWVLPNGEKEYSNGFSNYTKKENNK